MISSPSQRISGTVRNDREPKAHSGMGRPDGPIHLPAHRLLRAPGQRDGGFAERRLRGTPALA